VRVGIPYPAPTSGLRTSPKSGCRFWGRGFLRRDGVVAPFLEDESRDFECRVREDEGEELAERDDD
jgi:hypothetical protein